MRATPVVVDTKDSASIVRQARFTPEQWLQVKKKADELGIAYARFISYATLRALGPVEGLDTLTGDLAILRDAEKKMEMMP